MFRRREEVAELRAKDSARPEERDKEGWKQRHVLRGMTGVMRASGRTGCRRIAACLSPEWP